MSIMDPAKVAATPNDAGERFPQQSLYFFNRRADQVLITKVRVLVRVHQPKELAAQVGD
jgi:hypothetical protein